MSSSAISVFTAYFGSPYLLYSVLAVMLFFVLGLSWMMLTMKAWKDRNDARNKDDVAVLWIVLRGLFLLLLLVAVFMSGS
jgi:predicted permease